MKTPVKLIHISKKLGRVVIRTTLLLGSLFSLLAYLPLSAQDQAEPKDSHGAGVYVTALYNVTSDFPVTQNFISPYNPEMSAFYTNASSPGIVIGGYTIWGESIYAAVELGFSVSNFSDPNVSSKPFYFWDLLVLHIGLNGGHNTPFAFYGIFGGGLVHHSEEVNHNPEFINYFDEPMMENHPTVDYYLEESAPTMMFGLGARFTPISRIFLSVEYKWMYHTTESISNTEVPGKPGFYYTSTSFDFIGNRFSIGVSYVIFED